MYLMKTETKNLLSLSNTISLEDFSLKNKEALASFLL